MIRSMIIALACLLVGCTTRVAPLVISQRMPRNEVMGEHLYAVVRARVRDRLFQYPRNPELEGMVQRWLKSTCFMGKEDFFGRELPRPLVELYINDWLSIRFSYLTDKVCQISYHRESYKDGFYQRRTTKLERKMRKVVLRLLLEQGILFSDERTKEFKETHSGNWS